MSGCATSRTLDDMDGATSRPQDAQMTPHERLEQATWDLAWIPPNTRVIDRPELLALGCDRDIAYLNVVLRTRARSEQLPRLIDEVAALHVGHPSRWSVADTVPTDALERALTRAGYMPSHVHDARLLDVASFRSRQRAVEVRRVVDEATLRDCWAVNDAAFGPTERTGADVALEVAACEGDGARVQRYVAYFDGSPASSGGINLYPQLGIGLLWGGGTAPSARGRGGYVATVEARLAAAKRWGIPFAGLYARAETSSPIVASLGFQRFGRMTYFTKRIRDARESGRPSAGR
jgi:hypothetical protein